MTFFIQDLIYSPHERYRWYVRLPPWRAVMTQLFSYLSVWSLLFPVLLPECLFSTRAYVYTTTVCSVGGAYLTWIHPRQIPVHYLKLILVYPETVVMDLLAHQLPMGWCWRITRRLLKEPQGGGVLECLMTRWVVLLYWLCIGVDGAKIKYHIREMDILKILLLAEIGFYYVTI